jgi:hypothetical protein
MLIPLIMCIYISGGLSKIQWQSIEEQFQFVKA